MSAVTLVDHIPELLDEIADIAEEIAAERVPDSTFETARRHAVDRLADGFDITTIVRELSLLRGAALDVWGRVNGSGNVAELRALDLAIDRAIAVSVGRYTEAHERTLAGIDRISTASFESTSVPDLLQRLLTVFKETTPAVDTAAILLVEGDRLHLRAAVGLDRELARGASVAIGEGFAGTIAARREPMALRSAYVDPLVQSEEVREKAVRALYGVPLIHDDRVIGVAHMGSVTAYDFSPEDRQFLSSMAARATLGIVVVTLAAERERTLAKLESLLAAAPAGVAFLDRDLRYLRINDALAAINGRPAAEHIGRTVAEMLPDVAAQFEPLLHHVFATGEAVVNLEATRNGRSFLGSYFPVRTPGGDVVGVGAIAIDVTDVKQAQEALRVQRARLQAIIDHAPCAIWVKDPEGRVVIANQRLAEVLGHLFEQVEHEAHDQTVLATQQAVEYEESVPSPDCPRTFLSVKFPIPGDPPLVGGIATEITQRKRMEHELRLAVRTREDVLAVVSHDLRNPLGTVQLSASMLIDKVASDHRARRHVEMIQRSCKRMENLIDDLLDTTSIREGRLQLNVQHELADDVVAEALDLQQPVAEERGIKLVRDCFLDGVEITCDRDRLLQVFANLIGNAVKFCRAGDTITVHCERVADVVRFAVADTGPGIAPEVLPYVFEAYWSGERKTNRGSGLGLYIARGLIEGHGGQIGIDSAPGVGTTVHFTLPVGR